MICGFDLMISLAHYSRSGIIPIQNLHKVSPLPECIHYSGIVSFIRQDLVDKWRLFFTSDEETNRLQFTRLGTVYEIHSKSLIEREDSYV